MIEYLLVCCLFVFCVLFKSNFVTFLEVALVNQSNKGLFDLIQNCQHIRIRPIAVHRASFIGQNADSAFTHVMHVLLVCVIVYLHACVRTSSTVR